MSCTKKMYQYVGLSLFTVCFWGLALAAEAATLSLSPGTGVYTAGQTFTARVVVNTTGDAINAAEGTLSFDTSALAVSGITKGSIFTLWAVDPTYSNSAGTISFGGGSPSGYTGGAGTVLSITFRAKTAGTGKVTFSNGSVLAADGRGTNVLTTMNSGSYTIVAAEVAPEPEVIEYIAPANTPGVPSISSVTHGDADGWYQTDVAEFSWSIPNDVVAVRTLLDENSGSIPTKVYEPAIDSLTISGLEEGVQYLHVQFRNAEGWGRVAHYRIARDSTAPESFTVGVADGSDLTNPVQTLTLDAKDKVSGIAKYLVTIDGGESYEYIDETGSSTLVLPSLEPGAHTIVIEALDYAGNSIIASQSLTILAFDRPVFTEYPAELNSGVIPVIKGTTRPQANVTVEMRKVGEEAIVAQEVESNDLGAFAFIPDSAPEDGVYELTAYATDQYGAKSEASETIRIAVQQPGYLYIGSLVVDILSVLIPLLAMIGLLVVLAVYFWYRIRRIGASVQTETSEALVILRKEFTQLQKTLEVDAAALAKSRKTKKLTKAEVTLVDHLKTKLREAEEHIKKEVAEVDDIVE